MKNPNLKGTGVAVVTPFLKGKIDFPALTKIVKHLIKGGVDYLVPLGSTGESTLLNAEEQRSVLDHVISVNNGKLPIVAGNFGGNNTKALIEKIIGFNFTGIDAILSSSPEYVKPSQEGIFKHFMALEKICPVPIIIYNVPGRTRSNIEWETTIRLANASKKFIGIKEASGDLIQATRIIKRRPKNFLVLSGDDELALPLIGIGGDGLISVIGNVLPKEYSSMIKFALNGDFKKAQKINNHLFDLHHWLYIESNPVGIKTAMQIKGLCESDVRLPLFKMSTKNFKELKNCLQKI